MPDFEYHDNTKNCLNAIGEDALKKMTAAVNAVRLNTLGMLSHPGTGRVYKVPGVKSFGKWDYENMGTSTKRAGYTRTYIASSPGDPPAVATGDLKKSISTKITVTSDTIIGEVGSKKIKGKDGKEVDYGAMLEYGTSKMLARPWLRPSFQKSEEQINEIFQKPMGWGIE